jgi:hypothetical protein
MSNMNKVSDINALHNVENSNATVTLRFGMYMNGGSWNINTARVYSIIRGLNKACVSVQCEVITQTTHEAWECSRDSVEVFSSDGVQLAFHPDLQHNRNFGALRGNCRKIVAETLRALQVGGGAGAGAGSVAANYFESSSSESSDSETSASASCTTNCEGDGAKEQEPKVEAGEHGVPLKDAIRILRQLEASGSGAEEQGEAAAASSSSSSSSSSDAPNESIDGLGGGRTVSLPEAVRLLRAYYSSKYHTTPNHNTAFSY